MRGLWLVLYVLLCSILSVRLHSIPLMIGAGTGILLAVFLKIYAIILLQGVKEQIPAADNAILDVPYCYKITLKNAGKTNITQARAQVFGTGVCRKGRQKKKLRWKGSLPWGKTAVSEYELLFVHCGIYSAGQKRLKIYDPFGFVKAVRRRRMVTCILVLPPEKICAAAMTLTKGQQDQENAVGGNRLELQPEEVRDIRPYQAGDTLRYIHWNHSARMEELYVREFETRKTQEVILWVTDEKPEKRSSRAWDVFYEILYAWIIGLLSAQSHIRVYWKSQKLPEVCEQVQIRMAEDIPELFRRLYLCQGKLKGMVGDMQAEPEALLLRLDCSRKLFVQETERIAYTLDAYEQELGQEVYLG